MPKSQVLRLPGLSLLEFEFERSHARCVISVQVLWSRSRSLILRMLILLQVCKIGRVCCLRDEQGVEV